MPLLLPAPELQFCDGNGDPYSGGTIAFFIWGTDTPKDTWQDHDGTVLNTNPVVLDSAGRALIFGSGDYRAILKDADGNLIYDQWTSSVVSDAMQPVVRASTIADAQTLLGITSSDEINARIAVETARAEAAETTLTTNLAAEVARAEAEEANLQSQITALSGGTSVPVVQAGTGTTNSLGAASITFATAYPTGVTPIAVATANAQVGLVLPPLIASANHTTLSVYSGVVSGGTLAGGYGGVTFNWIVTDPT